MPQHIRDVIFDRGNVKRTLTIALVVGSVFFAMNQLGVIIAGHATPLVWVKAVLTYLTPVIVSNLGVLSATRRNAARSDNVLEVKV
jgi:hypothetical protein